MTFDIGDNYFQGYARHDIFKLKYSARQFYIKKRRKITLHEVLLGQIKSHTHTYLN